MRMILETERLLLRGWRDEDAPSLFKYASDERIGPAAGWPPHKDVSYSRAVIRTVFARDEVYAICLKGMEKEPVGSIGLTLEGSKERPLSEGEAELGYWIGYPFWGRGLVPEAAIEILKHGFMDLGLKRVLCGYFQGNERSKRVQEKCCFKYLRTNNDTKVIMLGETKVEHINVLTREEFFFYYK
ncbi:GNAT family N-acetyltransferase [Butyrivibrio sp. YAB3001]|uniref:GNAT family N-acetyltransferase n=1 Tax=Butyrivibrio sp. YAB3001 TaxID=1520812 RepID=UPI0008F63CB2|nr:GNAT family N-acetyltransferase [Butyrivibrio sp. YAB3001]SFC80793.1 Protein N-acetyltransferase, RimJ/RimL family [Butyrivibrio sp. YAB3001]